MNCSYVVHARELTETFIKYLGYAPHALHNPTKVELQAKMQEVSDMLEMYAPGGAEGDQKVIVFAFSGHGCSRGSAEKLYTNDGEVLDFQDEIVLPLTRHENVYIIPKLSLSMLVVDLRPSQLFQRAVKQMRPQLPMATPRKLILRSLSNTFQVTFASTTPPFPGTCPMQELEGACGCRRWPVLLENTIAQSRISVLLSRVRSIKHWGSSVNQSIA